MTDSTKDVISKLFIEHSMHTNQALISDLVVLVDQAIIEAAAEEKIKTKKIVDDVKDSLYKIQRMGVIDFRGEKLEVITRYQAVNTINISGLPYTSISGTGRSD